MIETTTIRSGIARHARTWLAVKRRLKPFLLSLINATLVLGIIFAVTGLILANRIENFTANVVSEVNLGLLQEIDADVRQVAEAIRATNTKLQKIADELDGIVRSPKITMSPAMQDDMRKLISSLKSVRKSITNLTSSHEELSDQSIRTIGTTVADTIIDIRKCRARPALLSAVARK